MKKLLLFFALGALYSCALEEETDNSIQDQEVCCHAFIEPSAPSITVNNSEGTPLIEMAEGTIRSFDFNGKLSVKFKEDSSDIWSFSLEEKKVYYFTIGREDLKEKLGKAREIEIRVSRGSSVRSFTRTIDVEYDQICCSPGAYFSNNKIKIIL